MSMDELDWLAERFQAHRSHLRAVAYRMLGSSAEADDAVQDTWLRFSRADTSDVANLGGWLTTVVARVCLDLLRARDGRREDPLDGQMPGSGQPDDGARHDPERQALLTDSVGRALLVVLDTLGPAERVAFVLHDLFDVSFDEIAPIVERTPVATRKLASRARQRVRGASDAAAADPARQRAVVDAFLAASRGGDFDALLSLLDPEVVLRADAAAVLAAQRAEGAPALAAEVRGPQAVAESFSGRAQAAQPALINGQLGMVWAPDGHPRAVFAFTIVDGLVTAIDLRVDQTSIRELVVVLLD